MITTKLDNGRVFLHNGDYSGDLLINCRPSEVEHLDFPDSGPMVRVSIPFEDIKVIVAEYVRQGLVADIEKAADDELLLARRGTSMPEVADLRKQVGELWAVVRQMSDDIGP